MTAPHSLSLSKQALLRIQELEAELATVRRAQLEPIAIVGMSCRLPGGIDGPEAFWRALDSGIDVVGEVPPDRWRSGDWYHPDPATPGKIASRWGGFVADVQRFDAHFFGIGPKEAASMDPQQRLLLEGCFHAFEDAGWTPDPAEENPVGVFVGISSGDYSSLLLGQHPGAIDGYLGTGTAHSVAAGRVSYAFGLRGPSVAVNTACSSSLVALHLACQSLRHGDCRVALAAGVNVVLAPQVTLNFSKARMLAADGRCKPFSAEADGYSRSEGCGVVVLKRLSDALYDGDRVDALVLGSAVNHDGRSSSLTAPHGPSQEVVIKAALAAAGVAPAAVDYVEAHGTGTALGDPIEVRALSNVFGPGRPPGLPLHVGSAKAHLGHLEAASGVAGLIKVVLALRHAQIPAQIHFARRNPLIPWSEIPVAVADRAIPWRRGSRPRIAGISTFGFGGTNAHLLLGEPPADPAPQVGSSDRALCLSAKRPAALAELAQRYAAWLPGSDACWADVCDTAAAGRTHFAHRLAVVARSSKEAADRLSAWLRGDRPDRLWDGRVADESLADHLRSAEMPSAWDGIGSRADGDPQALALWDEVASAYIGGRPLHWRRIVGGRRRHATIPVYPFQREWHWVEGMTFETDLLPA